MIDMKKISFVLLLLSFAISIKGQVNTKDSIFPNSTNESKVFETGPEIKNEEALLEKIKTLNQKVLHFIKDNNKDDIIKLNNDSLVLRLIVNREGKVDSVYQLSPRYFSFDRIKKFIKNYDFNGRLVEFFFEVNKPVRCTLQLIIFLLEQKMVRISARILEIKIEY